MNAIQEQEGIILCHAIEQGSSVLRDTLRVPDEALSEPARLLLTLIREIEGRKGAATIENLIYGVDSHPRKSELEPLRAALMTAISTPALAEQVADSIRERHTRAQECSIGRKLAEGLIERGEALEKLQSLESIGSPRTPRIRFFKPSELRSYEPENGVILFGENHICRGEVFVIGGEPGVGKSTAATELAICGATGSDWLGLKTHGKFKTLIIQNENGRYRLQQEYAARELGEEIEDSILVSEPPPYGMTLNHLEFLADVKAALEAFVPDVVIFDPWNAAARDDKAADYSAAFDALRNMLPKGNEKPALGIVAHTKKPQANEKRTGGSGLMHLLAGSYVLTSVPRAIFIMVRGGNDETDNSVVWFNPKNSNGPAAPRTAWERAPKGFTPLTEFDWKTFEGGDGGRKVIRLEHIQAALGKDSWERAAAVEKLEQESDCGKRACQKALSEKSPFASHLEFEEKWVKFKTNEDQEGANE